MINMNTDQQKEIDYPAELTFKAIFRNNPHTGDSIKNIVLEQGAKNLALENKASSNGKFISYTITAEFPSNKTLNSICSMVSELEGFMTLF
jgi:putative lipoic acid-binding regulatory protein